MTDALTGVELKIARAKRHLAELEEAIDATLDDSEHSFPDEFDPQTGKHVYRVRKLPTINPEWSLIAGEVLYSLRSALDHLAWQLVLLDGGTPGDQTQFPVHESPFNKDGSLRTVQLTPPVKHPKILAALDECQPYRGPDGHPAIPYNSFLWRVNKLNNIDKHRLLLVVVCVLDTGQMWWGGSPDQPVPKLKVFVGPLKENSEVAWFDFGGAPAPPDFNPHPEIAITLDEPATPEIRLVPIIKSLDGFCHFVEWDIINFHFRPLFP